MWRVAKPRLPLLRTLAALVFACAQSASAQELAIGVAGPMSGPLAAAGRSLAAGVSVAAQDVNARSAAKYTIVIEDDGANPAGGRKAAQALAGKGVKFVIGHYTSAPTAAANEIYAKNNVLLLAPSASLPKLTAGPARNVFRLAAREDAQAQFAGFWLAREFGKQKIAIVEDGSASSRMLAGAAADVLRAAGAALLPGAEIVAGAADGPAQAARAAQLLTAGEAAAIYWSGGGANFIAVLAALREAGSAALVLGGEALASPDIAGSGANVLDGLRAVIPAPPPRGDASLALMARLKQAGASDLPLALAAYASMETLAQARAMDRQNPAAALRQGRVFETAAGPVSFGENGERRETLHTIAIWRRAIDGRFSLAPP